MEHGLKDIALYIKKTYNILHSCHNFPAGSRQAARGARNCETSLFPMLWRLVYAYVTIRLFSVVSLKILTRKYINEHRVVHYYGLCAMVKTSQDGDLNAHV